MSTKKCILVGLINLLFCAVLWLFLIPFLIGNENENEVEHRRSKRYVISGIEEPQPGMKFDLKDFNPFQKFLDHVFSKIEEQLVEGQEEQGNKDYVGCIKNYFQSILSCTMVLSIIYAVSCVLMIIGSCWYCLRGLMLPYLLLQLVFNIIISTFTILLHVAMVMMSKHPNVATVILMLSYLYAAFIIMNRVFKNWIFNFLCTVLYFLINSWTLMFSLGNLYTKDY